MSAVYPTWKSSVLTWATSGGGPSDAEFMLAICDESFVFNSAHVTLPQVAGVLYEDIPLENVTFLQGRVRADDTVALGIAVGDVIAAVVLYLKWAGATQLICCITESTDSPLPIEMIGESLTITWDSAGIVQL